jgi:catechol 2,3-dioxygenase-like lactoylglutathione lyase family enzyme
VASLRRQEDAVPVTSGFNHVATLTTDLARVERFYGEVFDAEVTLRMEADGDHPAMIILDLGGGGALNVFEVAPEDIVGERGRLGGRGPIDHFGLAVTSRAELDEVLARLVGAGADVGEIQRLGDEWSLFFRDVDGMELEVCAPTS